MKQISGDLQHMPSDEINRFLIVAMRWRSWRRHYATGRKVMSSSPDEVDYFFQVT
jgi:hypothetical protein